MTRVFKSFHHAQHFKPCCASPKNYLKHSYGIGCADMRGGTALGALTCVAVRILCTRRILHGTPYARASRNEKRDTRSIYLTRTKHRVQDPSQGRRTRSMLHGTPVHRTGTSRGPSACLQHQVTAKKAIEMVMLMVLAALPLFDAASFIICIPMQGAGVHEAECGGCALIA